MIPFTTTVPRLRLLLAWEMRSAIRGKAPAPRLGVPARNLLTRGSGSPNPSLRTSCRPRQEGSCPGPQHGGLVGQAGRDALELGDLAVWRHGVQRFFHRRVAKAEPLQQSMNTQHRLDDERRAPRVDLGVARRHDLHQRIPSHPAFHLRQELALARLRPREVQTESKLLHHRAVRVAALCSRKQQAKRCADHP